MCSVQVLARWFLSLCFHHPSLSLYTRSARLAGSCSQRGQTKCSPPPKSPFRLSLLHLPLSKRGIHTNALSEHMALNSPVLNGLDFSPCCLDNSCGHWESPRGQRSLWGARPCSPLHSVCPQPLKFSEMTQQAHTDPLAKLWFIYNRHTSTATPHPHSSRYLPSYWPLWKLSALC